MLIQFNAPAMTHELGTRRDTPNKKRETRRDRRAVKRERDATKRTKALICLHQKSNARIEMTHWRQDGMKKIGSGNPCLSRLHEALRAAYVVGGVR
jgi:uncharacterized membrane protein YccC